MDSDVERALKEDMVIDITTTGRKSGEARRIEIWSHRVEGRVFITGTPGTRSWYANMVAHPSFTYHLKGDVKADLPSVARPIVESAERRTVLDMIWQTSTFRRDQSIEKDEWVERSPLVEVTFQD